jgi:hypothetical protein
MKYIRGFVLFWYDFIVGDDWRVAAGIILAFAGTAGLAALDIAAWWLMPVAALALLSFSLWQATRRMQ